ncbi:MAG: PEGA domain-containing protein [Ignavibacteriales bacterium]|nr:PEGA domain-containing protein [Ignavibacteriales bacterium]
MKKQILIPIILLVGFLFYSCTDTTTNNPETPTTGSIYVTSIPTGAQIWINNQNKGNTPDSVVSLTAGLYQVTLKLDGYKDTTVSVTVIAGQKATKNVVLTISLVTVSFGPVRIWETTGTNANQPSGLVLSTGEAFGISSTNKDKVDLYYYTNSSFTVHELRSANNGTSLTRSTYFKLGNSTNLNDKLASPAKDGTWDNKMSDLLGNYVFLYDQDKHYSKIIITSIGGGTIGVPAWVEVQWIYNQTVDDKRF